MNIYLVMKFNPDEALNTPDLQGVFSSLEKATAACRDRWHTITILELDQELPQESIEGLLEVRNPVAKQWIPKDQTEWILY